MRQESSARFASVTDFCDAFQHAIECAGQRQASRTPVRIESAGGSLRGAMHEVLGMPNQDAFNIAALAPDVLLAVVADGVSHARVGSGDRASRIALDGLTRRLPELLATRGEAADIAELLTDVFFETSSKILADALADPAAVGEIDPTDVMSSTALVGLVRGNELTLATVGDSRAYLVRDGFAEQLTVDGDMRCLDLAAGLPPEQIAALGGEAYSLCTCLGVGQREPDGTLIPSRRRAQPAVTRWTLLPGDVILLCTDGLAEEGLFLSPADLARLVGESRGGSASELVDRLIAAANDCHRLPSEADPYGLRGRHHVRGAGGRIGGVKNSERFADRRRARSRKRLEGRRCE